MPAHASLPLRDVNALEPLVGVPSDELSWLSRAHTNILVVGDEVATGAALSDLQSAYDGPLVEWSCGGLPLVLPPADSANTLILHGIASLLPAEQQMLSDWLSDAHGRTHVVATSTTSLLPLVASGAFLEILYYRLNIIYVDVTAPSSRIEPAAEDS